MTPGVSVIIPTYNRRGFLGQAIQSCFAGNDALDVEVIVVDDGSTDGTRDYLRSLAEGDERVRPVFQEHHGAQVARNRGLSEAQGAFIKFLDSDDRLIEGALVTEIEALRTSEAAISYGSLQVREADGEEWTFQQSEDVDLISGIFEGSIWTYPHVFSYRRQAIRDLEWDPSIPYEQDKSFAVQVASLGLPVTRIDQPVALLCRHKGERISTTVKSEATNKERFLRRIDLIEDGIQQLRERSLLEPHHIEAAARGMWRWAYMMAVYDFSEFEQCYSRIKRIAPDFRPSRSNTLLTKLDRWGSPRITERLIYPVRKVKHALSG